MRLLERVSTGEYNSKALAKGESNMLSFRQREREGGGHIIKTEHQRLNDW